MSSEKYWWNNYDDPDIDVDASLETANEIIEELMEFHEDDDLEALYSDQNKTEHELYESKPSELDIERAEEVTIPDRSEVDKAVIADEAKIQLVAEGLDPKDYEVVDEVDDLDDVDEEVERLEKMAGKEEDEDNDTGEEWTEDDVKDAGDFLEMRVRVGEGKRVPAHVIQDPVENPYLRKAEDLEEGDSEEGESVVIAGKALDDLALDMDHSGPTTTIKNYFRPRDLHDADAREIARTIIVNLKKREIMCVDSRLTGLDPSGADVIGMHHKDDAIFADVYRLDKTWTQIFRSVKWPRNHIHPVMRKFLILNDLPLANYVMSDYPLTFDNAERFFDSGNIYEKKPKNFYRQHSMFDKTKSKKID